MPEANRSLVIVFVCSGNVCRSPMAAAVLRTHLRREGLDGRVRVTSSGIGSWHVGEPADPRTAETLRAAGYPTEHVAAQIGPADLAADLLVALDSGHAAALRRQVHDPGRVRLLRSFDPNADGNPDVPDPYFGGENGFDEVLDMIHAAVPGLLAWTRQRL